MFAFRHVDIDKKSMLQGYPSEALFRFANPDSALPIQQYRPIAIEILFERDDETSEALQNQLLNIYLEKTYGKTSDDLNATNAVLKALEGRIACEKATISQKLAYVLMKAKINNITVILDRVSKINVRLIDIQDRETMHPDNFFYRDIFVIFMNTFSEKTKGTYISSIDEGVRSGIEERRKHYALLALSALEKANKPAFITQAWIDAIFLSPKEWPLDSNSLKALDAIFKARPDLVTSEKVDAAVQELNEEASSDTMAYKQQTALRLLGSMLRARPELIDSKIDVILQKSSEKNSDVREAALNTLQTIFQVRPDLITSERVDAVVKRIQEINIWPVEDAALNALQVMIRLRPEFITNTMFNAVLTTRSFPSSFWINSPIKTLRTMLESRPDLAAAITSADPGKLNKVDPEVREDVLEVIGEIYRARRDLVTETSVANVYRLLRPFWHDNNIVYQAMKALDFMFQARPDLVTVDRLNVLISYLSAEYPMRIAALRTLQPIVQARQDLVAHIKVDDVVRMLEDGSSHTSLIVSDATKALQAMIHALPQVARDNKMNGIVTKQLDEYVDRYRYGAFRVCISMFEANPDFVPQHRSKKLEGQVLEFYIEAMKLLPRPAPIIAKPAQNNHELRQARRF